MTKPCTSRTCGKYPTDHYHSPGGVVDTALTAAGYKVYPFRPGKTRRDNGVGKNSGTLRNRATATSQG